MQALKSNLSKRFGESIQPLKNSFGEFLYVKLKNGSSILLTTGLSDFKMPVHEKHIGKEYAASHTEGVCAYYRGKGVNGHCCGAQAARRQFVSNTCGPKAYSMYHSCKGISPGGFRIKARPGSPSSSIKQQRHTAPSYQRPVAVTSSSD